MRGSGGRMADGRAAPGRDVAANPELWTRVNARTPTSMLPGPGLPMRLPGGSSTCPSPSFRFWGCVRAGGGRARLRDRVPVGLAGKARARPTGVDLTAAQPATARRRQDRFGIRFPLVEADAGDVPLPGGNFDLAVSECGASLWCDPDRWVPEAARLPRSAGRLVFHTTSVLAAVAGSAARKTGGRSA